MRFLVSTSTPLPPEFGVMASPSVARSYAGIIAGLAWAADCEAFTGHTDIDQYLRWLEAMEPWRSTCLFAVCPDLVGDAETTLQLYEQWHHQLAGWPVAFVAQDGQERLPLPESAALFIGGTTTWKVGPGAIACIARAGDRHIHIGRVNKWRRYRTFYGMEGSNEWTCDGTCHRFMGQQATFNLWQSYMAQPPEPYLDLFGGDRTGEPERGISGTTVDDR